MQAGVYSGLTGCVAYRGVPQSRVGYARLGLPAIHALAISPGRAAAGGGHGRLAEGERAFCTFMSDILMQRAFSGDHGEQLQYAYLNLRF